MEHGYSTISSTASDTKKKEEREINIKEINDTILKEQQQVKDQFQQRHKNLQEFAKKQQ